MQNPLVDLYQVWSYDVPWCENWPCPGGYRSCNLKMEFICDCINCSLKLAWRKLIAEPVHFIRRCLGVIVNTLMLPPRRFWWLCLAVPLALRTLAQLISALLDFKRTKEELKKQEDLNESYKEALRQAEFKINSLSEQVSGTQRQKDDALSRLSELMSLKLRDGNPNVVDLGDEYRPTKLAELSNELYDNEWTDAYEFLETNNEQDDDSERQNIQFLLDVLLEAFEFCTKVCMDEWESLVSKIRGNNVEIKTEDKKLLKDLRKRYASGRLQDIEKRYLDQLEVRYPGHYSFKSEPILKFVQGCVKLCWLMQFQDPPVIFACPEWNRPVPLTMASPLAVNNGSFSPSYDQLSQSGLDENKQAKQNETDHFEIICEKTEPVKTESRDVLQTVSGQFVETALASGSRSHGNKMAGQAVERSSENRLVLDRGLYKDFTKKGKYIDFIAWPVMYLHEGGAILCKGVAQGCD